MQKITADEAYDIIQDRKRLIEYTKNMAANIDIGKHGDKEKVMEFVDELPYEKIVGFVQDLGNEILSKIPDAVKADLVFEHVGSTSIKGMPGTWHPDAAIFTKELNPPKEVVTALLDTGFNFIGIGRLHKYDLWFVKPLDEGFLKGCICKIHVTKLGGDPANCVQEVRDTCRKEQWAFDSYKNSKVTAAKHLAEGNMMEYKKAKGNCELLKKVHAKNNIVVPLDLNTLD